MHTYSLTNITGPRGRGADATGNRPDTWDCRRGGLTAAGMEGAADPLLTRELGPGCIWKPAASIRRRAHRNT
jgi:hypothetical protein